MGAAAAAVREKGKSLSGAPKLGIWKLSLRVISMFNPKIPFSEAAISCSCRRFSLSGTQNSDLSFSLGGDWGIFKPISASEQMTHSIYFAGYSAHTPEGTLPNLLPLTFSF